MATEPKFFDIEDTETGKVYRIETDDPTATYDDAVGYFSTLPEDQWNSYEYNSPEPVEAVETEQVEPAIAGPVAAPSAPVREPVDVPVPGAGVETQPRRATQAITTGTDYVLGIDKPLAPKEIKYSLAPEQEAQYVQMVEDPNVSIEQLNSFLVESGADPITAPEELANIQKIREQGGSSGLVTYKNPFEGMEDQEYLASLEDNSDDSAFGEFSRSLLSSWADPATGSSLIGRGINDLLDTGKEDLRAKFPDASEEELEDLQERYTAYLNRKVFEARERGVSEDRVVPWLAGQLFALDPVDAIPFGRAARAGTKAGRVAEKATEAAVLNAGADAIYQGLAVSSGAQDEFDPVRTGVNAALGATLGGGVQGVEELVKTFRRTPDSPPPAPDRAPLVVPEGNKRTKAYKEALSNAQATVVNQINELTYGWTNAPEISVYENFKGLKGVDNDAIGVYTTKTLEDGSVVPAININTQALLETAKAREVSPESLVEAVTFHEALGHHGLSSLFDKDLESFLDDIYVNGDAKFQAEVDDWLEANPEAYKNLGEERRRIFATEEVLAEASEQGPLVRSRIDAIANYIKDFARNRMGMDLKYSQREIRAYLAVAHDRTMKGRKNEQAPDVTRNIYVGSKGVTERWFRSGVDEPYNPKFEALAEDLDLTREMYRKALDNANTEEELANVKATYSREGLSREYTGWFLGDDNKWRFEISDDKARVKMLPAGKEKATLGEVLDHSDLFEIYPQLKDVNVKIKSGSYGSYNEATNTLTLSPSYSLKIAMAQDAGDSTQLRLAVEEAKSTLLHEIQHAVQGIEDFARGGTPDYALERFPTETLVKGTNNYIRFLNEVELKPINQKLRAAKNVRETPEYKEFEKAENKSKKLFELYKNLSKPDSNTAYVGGLEGARAAWLASQDELRAAKIKFHEFLGYPEFILEGEQGLTRKQVDEYYELMGVVKSPMYLEMRRDQFKDKVLAAQNALNNPGNTKAQRSELLKVLKKDRNVEFDAYQHLLGEAEARDVQARMNLTAEERQRIAPLSSEPELDVDSLSPTTFDDRVESVSDSRRLPREEETTSAGFNRPRINNRSAVEARKQFWRNKDNPDWNPNDPNGLPSQRENRYMRGSSKKDDEGDFERRMTNILEEIRDAYVPTERSQAEAQRAARQAGLRSSQYKSQRGLQDLDVRLFQYDAVNDRYQANLLRLAERMENPKDANEYVLASEGFKRTLYEYKLLAAKIQGDQAQIGRALNAMKALNLTKRKVNETLGILDRTFGNKTEAEAFAALDDPAIVDALAKMMSAQIKAGNTAGAAKIAESVGKPYWWQYALSYLHNSMLSGLGTQAVNTYDAINILGRKLEERLLGSAIGAARRTFGAKDSMSAYEGIGFTIGILKALMDAQTYKNTYRAFREGYEFQPFDAKIERQDARIPILSTVNDALYASDMFWRAFHMSANLYSLGIRDAHKAGFRGKELFEEGYNRAVSADKALYDEAKLHADEALLVDKPWALTSWIEAGKNIKPNMSAGEQARAFTLNMLFPFLRVSDRLVFQALKRVPLVAFLDRNTQREWMIGGASRDAVLSRQLMGGALITYYWMMADPENADEKGYIEGYGDPNYKKIRSLEATGYRTESVVNSDGEMQAANQVNVTANPFNTNNNIAVLVASIRQGWESSNKTDQDANQLALGLTAAMRASGTFLMKQGYADNVTPYIEALTASSQQESAAAAAVNEVAARAVPAIVRQANQLYFDPIKRDTTGDKSFEDRVVGRIQSAIPGLSDLMPERRTALGDVQQQDRTLLRLDEGTPIKEEQPYQELRKLDRQMVAPVLTEFKGSFVYQGESIKLNAFEKSKWQAIQGQYLKDVMLEWVTSEDWKEMTDEEKVDVVKKVNEEAYAHAKGELIDQLLTARGK